MCSLLAAQRLHSLWRHRFSLSSYVGGPKYPGIGEAIAATRDTAINPAVLDAFVLVIIGSEGAPAYPGLPGYSPDLANARHDAAEVAKAMAELRKVVPEPGSYLAETSYFERDW